MRRETGKPIIETLINTTALALTSFAVMQITSGNMWGHVPLFTGMFLEFVKYWGRKRKLW